MVKPIHLSFEGIDGAGKTTQTEIQYRHLTENGFSVLIYKYCNKNNPWGKIIKKVYSINSTCLLKPFFKPRIIQELMYASSARYNLKMLNLGRAEIILSDRSIVTAYASHIDKIPERFISFVEPSFIPDLVIYLDIAPEIGIQRINKRYEKFRDEDLDSLTEFRNIYMRIIYHKRPENLKGVKFINVNAAKPLEEVVVEVTKIVDDYITRSNQQAERWKKTEIDCHSEGIVKDILCMTLTKCLL